MTTATEERPAHLADEDVAAAPAYLPKLDDNAALFPIKRSASIVNLARALSKAQKAFPEIEKDQQAEIALKTGGKYRYNYADLSSVLEATRGPLGDNGLSHVQPVKVDGPNVSVVTVLMHESGEWMCSDPLTLRAGDAADPRSIAIVISYARRYSLQPMLGISPSKEDDQDGAKAGQPREPRPAVQPAPRRSQPPSTQAQPAATQSVRDLEPEPRATAPEGAPANLGAVASITDLPSGAIGVTLTTGFKCAAKDLAIVEAMRAHFKSGAVIELTTKAAKPGFSPLIEEILVIPAEGGAQ